MVLCDNEKCGFILTALGFVVHQKESGAALHVAKIPKKRSRVLSCVSLKCQCSLQKNGVYTQKHVNVERWVNVVILEELQMGRGLHMHNKLLLFCQ